MTRIDLRKYPKAALAVVFLLFLHSLRYFDYIGVSDVFWGRAAKLSALLLIGVCLVSKSPRRMPGRYWMLALLMVPMLSFLPAWLENGQSPVESLRTYLTLGLVLVYFILHKAKIAPAYIAYGFTILAVVRLVIYIVQQFTYPDYLFSFRPEGLNVYGYFTGIEVRSGIYRYYIEDTYLSMFLVFYYLQKMIRKINVSHVIFFLVGLVGIYLDQSRQFMVSTLLAIMFVLFFSYKSRYKGWILLGAGVVILILLVNYWRVFEDLINMTKDDLSTSNIRLLSYATYGLEFWGGPLSVLFGNGPIGNSAYGDTVAYMYESLHLFHADVGLVGAANLYGVVTVLVFLSFFGFFVFRNWRKLEMHVKMYYVAMLVNAPLVTIYTQNVNWFVFFAFMLYLSDRDIVRYDRRRLKKSI